MQELIKQILKEYIREAEMRQSIKDYVIANYNLIPINSRYKQKRSIAFIDIAEACKLTLHTLNYKLIAEVLEQLGVREVETHGYKYHKGLILKSIELTEEHTKIIHSAGSHAHYKLPKKGIQNTKGTIWT